MLAAELRTLRLRWAAFLVYVYVAEQSTLTHAHKHTRTHTCAHTHTHTYVRARTQMCICTYVCAHTFANRKNLLEILMYSICIQYIDSHSSVAKLVEV